VPASSSRFIPYSARETSGQEGVRTHAHIVVIISKKRVAARIMAARDVRVMINDEEDTDHTVLTRREHVTSRVVSVIRQRAYVL